MNHAGTIALLESLPFGLGRLVDAADALRHRLCLLTGDRSAYAHELAALDPDRLDVVDLDTTDLAACEAALRAVPDLAGLVSSTEAWALPGAELAARLGLPGPDPDAVRTLRDKGAVRALLHKRNLSSAATVPASSARDLGFPLILEDSAGTSAWLVRDDEELTAALRAAADTPLEGRLIADPYFEGPLYSAETITWQGRTRLLGVTSRQLSPEPLRRAEAAAFPVAFPARDLADLADWIDDVLAAAGHRDGFAHTEFVLTTEVPEVVGLTPRIGGALTGEALCRSLGTNVYAATIAIALGRRPALLTEPLTPDRGVAFVLVHPPAPGVLTGWSGLDRLPDFPGAPEWYPTASPGDETGIVLTEGPTAELALHRALAAANAITPTS